MSAHVRFAVHVEGTYPQRSGLDRKRPLHHREALVRRYHPRRSKSRTVKTGSYDVDAVKILSRSRDHEISSSVTVISKCFSTFLRFASRPTRRLILSLPRSEEPLRRTAFLMSSRIRSVETRSSSRLRALCSLRLGLRHTIRRSPGNSGLTSHRPRRESKASGLSGASPSSGFFKLTDVG